MELPETGIRTKYRSSTRFGSLLVFIFVSSIGALQVHAQALSPDRTDCVVNVNTLPGTRTLLPIPALNKPPLGQSVVDPSHGTCITRLTNNRTTPGIRYLRHAYSRNQAFNANNSRVLTVAGNGFWHVIDTASAEDIGILPTIRGDAEPQWHVNNPDLLYFLPPDGGLSIRQLNVATGNVSTVFDFTGRLPWPQAARMSTRSEGSPSRNQRYWAFIVETENFTGLGMIVWDKRSQTIVGSIDFTEQGMVRPDHVSMSPTGRYVVASWFAPVGTIAYTRDFSRQVKLAGNSEHSDIALLPGNRDAFVSVNYQSNGGDIYYTDIAQAMATGEADQIALHSTYLNGSSNSRHISGKAFDRPGWVLLSVYGERHRTSPDLLTRQWHDDRIYALELKPDGRVINLAHHRSDVQDDYWQEPHATVNRDFTAVTFASDWGSNGALNVDSYLIDGLQWNDIPPTTQACNVSNPALQRTVHSGVWSLLSLPCQPPEGVGVGELLGDDLPGELARDWSVQVYDPASNRYLAATADTELKQGEGFWLVQVSGQDRTLDMPAGSRRWPGLTSETGCMVTDGCVSISLDGTLSPSPWQIIGNPLPRSMPTDTITVIAPAGRCSLGTGCSFSEASDPITTNLIRAPMWRFDDSISSPAYQSVGAGDALEPWDGAWIAQSTQAENNAPRLYVPFGE